MKLIRFYISKQKKNYTEIKTSKMHDLFEHKAVGVLCVLIYKKKGWKIDNVEYYLISSFLRFFKSLDVSNKIAIIALIMGSSIGIILYVLDKIYFLN
jgi:acetyl-CoA carboxylase carboxyltransferase component